MTGVSSSVLTTEKVVPVFKKDSKLDYSNYHPISLPTNIEKNTWKIKYILFSKTIMLSITQSLVPDKKYSTSHALINVTENIRKALDDGNIGCGVLVKLQKAFNTVDHQTLLKTKLNH